MSTSNKKKYEFVEGDFTRKQRHAKYLGALRAARVKLRAWCKKNGVSALDERGKCAAYAAYLGLAAPGKSSCGEWLYKIYASGVDLNIKRTKISNFYLSPEWLATRRNILNRYGRRCMKCDSDKFIAVDHIKPRSLFPNLELCQDNLQVLCRSCNSRKSNRHIVDYRK